MSIYQQQAYLSTGENQEELARYVVEELRRISIAFSNLAIDSISLQVLYVEPAKPQIGQVINADGVEWNPGEGAGMYKYDGAAWIWLERGDPGANLVQVPIGGMIPFAGTSVPTNFIGCDGASLSTTGTYAALFAAIGYTWGGAGASFNVPPLTTDNLFLRAADGTTLSVGDIQANQNASHTHTNSLAVAAGGAHTHIIKTESGTGGGFFALTSGSFQATTNTVTGSAGSHGHNISGSIDNEGGSEARPNAACVLYIIRYQ